MANNKPLVSFAARPRLKGKSDGVKKPAFRVVRRKASLSLKKKLTEVKNFNTTPLSSSKITTTPGSDDQTKPVNIPRKTNKPGADTNFMPVSKERVIKKYAPKAASSYNNTGVISSLFGKNPDIPTMTKEHVDITEENVFSSQSFSALKIHNFLV